jgi:hypothetical protein
VYKNKFNAGCLREDKTVVNTGAGLALPLNIYLVFLKLAELSSIHLFVLKILLTHGIHCKELY